MGVTALTLHLRPIQFLARCEWGSGGKPKRVTEIEAQLVEFLGRISAKAINFNSQRKDKMASRNILSAQSLEEGGLVNADGRHIGH